MNNILTEGNLEIVSNNKDLSDITARLENIKNSICYICNTSLGRSCYWCKEYCINIKAVPICLRCCGSPSDGEEYSDDDKSLDRGVVYCDSCRGGECICSKDTIIKSNKVEQSLLSNEESDELIPDSEEHKLYMKKLINTELVLVYNIDLCIVCSKNKLKLCCFCGNKRATTMVVCNECYPIIY